MKVFSVVCVLLWISERSSATSRNTLKLANPSSKLKVVFGTENGYDVGGPDPLCWNAIFGTENSTFADEISNGIELLNEQLFELADSAPLMPRCFKRTEFTVTPLNLEPGGIMLMGQSYTFSLHLTLDLKAINSLIRVRDFDGEVEIHFRLHMCDAVRQGFCNPVVDTRDRDSSLTRAESDLMEEDDESPYEDFVEDETKWTYSPNTTLIGLSDDDDQLKIYARWCKWSLRELDMSLFTTGINITLQVPVPKNNITLGQMPYFMVGHVVVGFELPNERIQRVDVAQTIPNRVVYLKAPPQILTVSTAAKAVLGVGIALVSAFALFCFVAIVRNQNHAVMRLAQGKFLAVMAAGCLIQTVFTYTYIPSKDVNCNLKGPMVLVPITLVAAVLVGRVWRVYSTLSNASTIGKQQGSSASNTSRMELFFVGSLDFMAAFPTCSGRLSKDNSTSRGSRRSSLRRTVTEKESFSLMIVLTLPQIVLQVVGSIVASSELVEDYNSIGSVGRIVCSDNNMWVYLVGTGYTTFVFLCAVLMAWFSRDLPSAFNEKDQIFHAATISAITTGMSIGVGTIINAPTTSPDADVMLWGISSIVVSASVLTLIIWPKVDRVFSGEVVVVSKMLGSRFTASTASSASEVENSEATGQINASPSEIVPRPRSRIVLGATDAMPSRIESKILQVQNLLKSVLKQSGDGKTLSSDEWSRVRSEVDRLKSDLDLLDIES